MAYKKMSQKVNMKTIAELAGVSVATVSRVINQNGRFSAETEANVKRVMKELHFYPNTVAKNLKENRSNVIGVIVPDITNPHFARLVLEIEKRLFEYSYLTVICNTNEVKELEQRHVDSLITQRVSGILIISGSKTYDLNDIPVIYVDRCPDDYKAGQHCIVESDNESGAYMATRKLIDSGCKNIAILYSCHTDRNQKMRYRGYKKAVEEVGFKEQTIHVDSISSSIATEAVKRYIESGNVVDGLVCTTDALAIGAIIGLQEKHLSVPEQVKVTGYDDSILAVLYHPSVSSIHQYVNRMAEKTVALLLAMIEKEHIDQMHNVLPVRLVERASTKIVI